MIWSPPRGALGVIDKLKALSSMTQGEKQMDDWHFRVFKSRAGSWIAIGKREPFVLAEPSAIREPGDLWFEFGDTEDDALTRLKRSLGLPT